MNNKSKNKINTILPKLSNSIVSIPSANNFNINREYIYNCLLEFCIYVIVIVNGFNDENVLKINYWVNGEFNTDELLNHVNSTSYFNNGIPLFLKNVILFDTYNDYKGQLFNGIFKLFSEIGYEFFTMDENGLRNLNEYKNFLNKIRKEETKYIDITNKDFLIQESEKICKEIFQQDIFNRNIDLNRIHQKFDDEEENIIVLDHNTVKTTRISDKNNSSNKNSKLIESESLESHISELNNYIGLKRVKQEIKELVSLIKIRNLRDKQGFKNPSMSYHLCFLGNPGTGKTTVARILAKIYKSLGIIKNDKIVEVGRQDLVGGYVGQTAIKTKSVIKRAYGGILFIDEAYSLTNKGSENDYGLEAIEVILKEMEDNRDNLIIIVAGYSDLMQDFINSNPGLKSRFNTYINFEDYNPEELLQILTMICKNSDYYFKCNEEILKYFENKCEKRGKDFSNARFVRNMFENAIKKQAIRLSKIEKISEDKMKEIILDDFNLEEIL